MRATLSKINRLSTSLGLFVVILLMTGNLQAQVIGPAANINGNFEDAEPGMVTDDDVDGWDLSVGEGVETDPEFEIVEDPVQDGSHALKILVNETGDDDWDIQAIADSIVVHSGQTYQLSVWAKAEEDGATANFTAFAPDVGEFGRVHNASLTTEWQEFELTFTPDVDTIQAPLHFSFEDNVGNAIYIDNLEIGIVDYDLRPTLIDAESGEIGDDFEVLEDEEEGVTYVQVQTDAWDDDLPDEWDHPINEDRVITYTEVTFPEAGEYNLFLRGRVGPEGADDDSFFYPYEFGENDPSDPDSWSFANQLDGAAGFTDPDAFVHDHGNAGDQVWKWMNISQNEYDNEGFTYTVDEGDLTQTFQIGGRETGFDIDRIALAPVDRFYTVEDLDSKGTGSEEIEGQELPHTGPPLAELSDDDHGKFLGNVYSGIGSHDANFEYYWNQVTPENASKWGMVEGSERGERDWSSLDAAYDLAKDNGFPFRFHVLIWGGQQPGWIDDLDEEEQLEAIEDWFHAVNDRYDDIDYLEVVNEPLHQRPDGETGDVDYLDALGGTGETGWDWVITSFEMARDIFPEETELMINDYNILSWADFDEYLNIIELLQERDLIDGIGLQGHAFETQPSGVNVSQMERRLDRLGETGLPIQITEMDIDGNPDQEDLTPAESDQIQLEAMQRIFPLLWEHEAVEGITMWGWRPGMWRTDEEAYLMRDEYTERPAMEWLREYLEDYTATSTETTGDERPAEFELSQNYPNPFNPTTQITYSLPETANITLKVYDTVGRHVRTLAEGEHAAGQYTVTFDASDFASGNYIYRLEAGSHIETRQMMFIK